MQDEQNEQDDMQENQRRSPYLPGSAQHPEVGVSSQAEIYYEHLT